MRRYFFQLFKSLEVLGRYIFQLLEALRLTAVSFIKYAYNLFIDGLPTLLKGLMAMAAPES